MICKDATFLNDKISKTFEYKSKMSGKDIFAYYGKNVLTTHVNVKPLQPDSLTNDNKCIETSTLRMNTNPTINFSPR